VSLLSLYDFGNKQFIRNTQHILLQIIMNFRTTMVHTLEKKLKLYFTKV